MNLPCTGQHQVGVKGRDPVMRRLICINSVPVTVRIQVCPGCNHHSSFLIDHLSGAFKGTRFHHSTPKNKMKFVFVVISILSTFSPVFAVQSQEVCLLQLDEGPCKGDVQRFYYNTLSQKCEEFSYGGCAGNDNNFRTFHECQKTCWKIPKIPQICRFPKEEGSCRAFLQRYFFNMTTMQCQPFYYGGCQGNNNRFDDAQSCVEYCRPKRTTPVMCLGPLDVGPCSASIPRFHYSPLTRTCERFLYSGCGGSSNNFVSRRSCLDICVSRGRPWKDRPIRSRSSRKKDVNNVQVVKV